jgi:hypothetical protein
MKTTRNPKRTTDLPGRLSPGRPTVRRGTVGHFYAKLAVHCVALWIWADRLSRLCDSIRQRPVGSDRHSPSPIRTGARGAGHGRSLAVVGAPTGRLHRKVAAVNAVSGLSDGGCR